MSLLDILQTQLAGEPAVQIGRQLGTDQAGAQKAICAALPILMAALAGNAVRKQGAASLASALDKDHDGGILDDLPGFLSRGDTKVGEGILKHALGGRRQAVESEVAKEMAPGTLGLLGKLLGGRQ